MWVLGSIKISLALQCGVWQYLYFEAPVCLNYSLLEGSLSRPSYSSKRSSWEYGFILLHFWLAWVSWLVVGLLLCVSTSKNVNAYFTVWVLHRNEKVQKENQLRVKLNLKALLLTKLFHALFRIIWILKLCILLNSSFLWTQHSTFSWRRCEILILGGCQWRI